MRYTKSAIDSRNEAWFNKDLTKNTLKSITIEDGHVRGLSNISIPFSYPITAIAGKNGSGKSTILALAACAFHNKTTGFNPKNRKYTYYTFSDFLIQTVDEIPPDGIKINYRLLAELKPEMKANATEKADEILVATEKKKGGKWKRYEYRPKRDVIYFGIDRVVPHSEKSVSKSYRRAFKNGVDRGGESETAEIVGRILGKKYEKFSLREHHNHRLPLVKSGAVSYSGFNMGAGENALFDIISTILSGPPGLLIIIDEIELGLHEEAQTRLIDELKKICSERYCQVICTTHSSKILGKLPPEGRVFLERHGNATAVLTKISPKFATGKLSGLKDAELELFVEDKVAKEIVEAVLTNDLRARIDITYVGSAATVARHMGSMFREKERRNTCAVIDGDKEKELMALSGNFLEALESSKDKKADVNWFKDRVKFLPGTVSPEKWALNALDATCIGKLASEFRIDPLQFNQIINRVKDAEVHTEFYQLSKELNLEETLVRSRILQTVVNSRYSEFAELLSFIESCLLNVLSKVS